MLRLLSGISFLFFTLSLVGCQSNAAEPSISGEQLYLTQCASCHQIDGQGIPGIYPPLAGSPWVTGSPEPLILIVLHGIKGPLEVNGQIYQGVMPAHARRLREEDITAILNFIRQAWGNHADSIALDQVRHLKRSIPRKTPWTETELSAFRKEALER